MLRSFSSNREVAFRNDLRDGTHEPPWGKALRKTWVTMGNFLKANSNYALYHLSGARSSFQSDVARNLTIRHSLTEKDYHRAVDRLSKFDHVVILEAVKETR